MGLGVRMFLLVAVLFAILYGVITAVGSLMGINNALFYLVLAFVFLGIQYLVSPALVSWTMRVKWVSESQSPALHRMIADLAQRANLPKPRVGISELSIPNAFAFGRTQRDGRICVTRGILNLLNEEELKAVLGHEMSHIKHRDMAVITLLSAIPMMLYWLAWNMMWGGLGGNRRQGEGGYAALIGLAAFMLYFITNLLVLYGSRIREYYADRGSVRLGNQPHHLATALYKLVHAGVQSYNKKELKQVEGARAFFVNDPSRSWHEVRDLSQLDHNQSGTITQNELLELRQREVRLGFGDRLLELFTTHPNMLKRIKQLSALTY